MYTSVLGVTKYFMRWIYVQLNYEKARQENTLQETPTFCKFYEEIFQLMWWRQNVMCLRELYFIFSGSSTSK